MCIDDWNCFDVKIKTETKSRPHCAVSDVCGCRPLCEQYVCVISQGLMDPKAAFVCFTLYYLEFYPTGKPGYIPQGRLAMTNVTEFYHPIYK